MLVETDRIFAAFVRMCVLWKYAVVRKMICGLILLVSIVGSLLASENKADANAGGIVTESNADISLRLEQPPEPESRSAPGHTNHPLVDGHTVHLWLFDSPWGGRVKNEVSGRPALFGRYIYPTVKSPTGRAYRLSSGQRWLSLERVPWIRDNLSSPQGVTLELWCRIREYPKKIAAALYYEGVPRESGCSLYIRPDGRVGFAISHPTEMTTKTAISKNLVKVNTWVHIAATYDGSRMQIYLNGRLDRSQAYSGGYRPAHANVFCGASPFMGSFPGDIDAIRVSSIARNDFGQKASWDFSSTENEKIEHWFDSVRPATCYMSLAGWWKYYPLPGARNFTWPIPGTDGKTPVRIYLPSDSPLSMPVFHGPNADYSWFTRTFTLSTDLKNEIKRNQRILLHLGGLGYRWQVRINGKNIAESLEAFGPHEFDVTRLLNIDGMNTIAIGTSNRNGCAAPEIDSKQIREKKGRFLIAPVGNRGRLFDHPIIGVWGEIELWSRPPRRITQIFVRPSVRDQKLDVDLNLTGKGFDTLIDIKVFDAEGKEILRFDPTPISPEENQSGKITRSCPWKNPILWDTDSPYMYTLEATLREGRTAKPLDIRRTKFGFRELWIDGSDLILNGKRLFLRRITFIPCVEKQARNFLEYASAISVNAVRLHQGNFYRPGAFASLADRMGILLIPEAPVFWSYNYRLGDERFWKNYHNVVRNMIQPSVNHPSIIMWSLMNEILWCDEYSYSPDCPRRMQQAADEIRCIDPTRWLQFDGDWDLPPLHSHNIVNLHYPWSPIDHWYPTECWAFFLLDNTASLPIRGKFGRFIWPRGTKPVIVGEFAHNSRTFVEAPTPMTMYLGDKAYDWETWSSWAMWRKLIRWQCDAWRVARFAGVNPWYDSLLGEKWNELMPPEIVVLKDEFRTFFSDEKTEWHAFVLNDTRKRHVYHVNWAVRDNDKIISTTAKEIEVEAGGMQSLMINIHAPKVEAPVNLTFEISLSRGQKTVWKKIYDIRVRPRAVLQWPSKTVLLDPLKKSLRLLTSLGISPCVVNTFDALEWDKVDALVLGEGALGTLKEQKRQRISQAIHNGLRVLTLGETRWPIGEGLAFRSRILSDSRANRAWIRAAGHPAIPEITNSDLAMWREGDWVTRRAMEKPGEPIGTAWRTLIDVGSRNGLDRAVLVEAFYGRGRIMICQLDLGKAKQDPGARAVLCGLLRDLKRATPPRTEITLVENNQPAGIVEELHRQAIETTAWKPCNISAPLLMQANAINANPRLVAAWVRKGGRAWVAGLDIESYKRWADVVPGGIRLQKCNPYDGCRVISGDPLTWGISNEEFFWAQGQWACTRERISRNERWPFGVWPLARLAKYSIHGSEKAIALTQPATMIKIPDGKGAWIFSTVDFKAGMEHVGVKTHRMLEALFANLGLSVKEGEINIYGDFQPICLKAYMNRGFMDEEAGDGKGGWTDQGEADLRFFPINLWGFDLDRLPAPSPKTFPHRMILANVEFEIIDPRKNHNRSCIMLTPDYHRLGPQVKRGNYLEKVKAIPVNRTFDRLHALHSAAWVQAPKGTKLWSYVLNYEDGTKVELPVRANIDVADWFRPQNYSNAKVGWIGSSLGLSPIGLYVAAFDNPHPEKKVASLDIVSARDRGIGGIIALSTSKKKSCTPNIQRPVSR